MTARRLVTPLFLVALLASVAPAQDGGRPVSLQRSVEPSFHIEPVVHRFKARRGEVIPFSFEIGSLGRAMEVELKPVSLRQEENGVILHDGKRPLGDEFEVETPLRFTLTPGTTQRITGRLKVPIARSNYLSYGLLVREAGAAPGFGDAADQGVQAGIRFVTQYVLRVDVETGVADGGAMKELRLEQTRLVAENGLPKVRAYLDNPTGFAFECFVSAGLQNPNGRPSQPARLGMQSRTGLDGDEKFLVRIMPHSRLRLEAPLTGALPLGPQMMTIDVSTGRRRLLSSDFAVDIRPEDFPALASRRRLLGPVSVSPAQLELGSIRQAPRTAALDFKNSSDEPMQVSLAPRGLDGRELESVRYSPATFTLRPGRSKRVRAMLRSAAIGGPRSAVTQVTVAQADGSTHDGGLPLSILTERPAAPELDVSEIRYSPASGGAFSVTVRNEAAAYVPVTGSLTVVGKRAGKQQMRDGYGAWLAPGASTDLVFRPNTELPAGEYTLGLSIETREGFDPIDRTLNASLR